MNLSEIFIRRPIATSLLMAGVVLLGLLGYFLLPISALPSVDFPTIQVTTQLPGASPEVMTSSVTTPLEQQFGQISGLTSMNSVSSFGVSTITLQFSLERSIDSAAQDVQAAINVATGVLPANLPNPPIYNKVNPADTAIVTLAITSDTLPIDQVNDLGDTLLAQKLSEVTGVGLVTIEGNQKPAVRVQVDPAATAAQGLSLEDVRTALGNANVDAPKGGFDGAHQAYAINANDQIFTAAGYRSVIVAYRNGAPIRLADIGRVVDSVENTQLAGWYGRQPAVILDIQRQPGANIIQTVDAVKRLLPSLLVALPPSVHVTVLTDRTTTIRASVADVQFTLCLTVFLVVLVIFLFLRKLWATVIPSIALPLAIIGTFGVMELAGFSLDNLSLMALTIATGFVVDDAIVMIENIVRYIEKGESPLEAALHGSKQIGFTVISLTFSLIAVFIPLLFMTGIVGRLFREFAITLSASIVMSAFVSLTLTPMMCARLLKAESEETHAHGRLYVLTERFFDGMLAAYDRGLKWVLRRQGFTLGVAIATLATTIVLYLVIPKGLLPQQDTGLIVGVTDAAQNISFPAMVAHQRAIADIVLQDPDVASVSSFVGAGTINPTLNTGRITINLKPHDHRAPAADIIARLRARTAGVEGIDFYMQAVQDLQIDSRVSRTQYQYILEDADPAELAEWAPRLVDRLRAAPELNDVASDQQNGGYQIDINVDRERASRLNVLPQDIDNTLYDAFGQRQVSTIFTQTNQYRVILEVTANYRKNPEALSKIYVRANGGSSAASAPGPLVPLSAFATMTPATAPLVITHQGQFPSATISFNLRRGYSLSDAVAAVRRAQRAIGLPETVQASFSGSAAEFQTSLQGEPWLILAAIVVVYIVLGVLYESYIHPITILSSLPSAGVGALLALSLCRIDFSMVALIGIVLLIGIVQKNAIMMIDFALDAERSQGLPPSESIYQACLLRFRPIMMTTMAALLGALPLAIESGTGSELRRPLGVTMVGGLMLSQLITLYTTPVVYLHMDRLSRWLTGKNAAAAPAPAAVPRPVNLSGPFIRRPIGTSLLALGLLLAGAVAFNFLPIAPLPQIEFPTISVSGNLPGADPVTAATSIAAPLERRFAQIAGVSELTSTSSLGGSSVTIQFDLSRSVESAERDVQAAINASSSDLPAGLVTPPTYRNFNPSDSPIMILALTSETMNPGDVYNYGNDVIAQQLSQVPGVGQVIVSGAEKSAVRVQVDPAYLAALGLSLEDIRTFLSKSNANLPKGSLDGGANSYTLKVNDQLLSARDYFPLVLFQNSKGTVRLRDLGRVIDSVENTRQAGWYNGRPAVLLIVFKQPGANVIATVDLIHTLIPKIERWMPPAIKLSTLSDRTATIRASVDHIELTLLISIALVVMVVFIFLRRFWATVIPSCTVPLALTGTFAVMYLAGYTLDNLSLMALAVAVGFVVDDAIVVIENIVRYLEAGEKPRDAALKGARQIGFTVLSISVSLVAVFVPLIFMTGLVGRLLHEFAVTLTSAILVSGVVSLTFTPMMCSRFLKHESSEDRPNRFFRLLEGGFARMHGAYGRGLSWVLRHERLMLGVTLGTMVATVGLYYVIPKGFFPNEDTGNMLCTFEGAQDVSFVEFAQKHDQLNQIVRADPAVDSVGSFIVGGSNQGRMFIALKPLEVRKVDIFTVIARLRRQLARVEGVTLFMTAAQDLRVGGRSSKSTYQYTLTGSNLADLNHWSDALVAALQAVPHFQDVTSDLQAAGLQARVVVDRDAVSRLGLNMSAVDNTLYDAFGQRQVSVIYLPLSQHHVVLEASPQYQLDPASLDRIYVKSPQGRLVPLGAIARVERTNTALSVNHQGQFPAVTISFNLDEGYSLSDATDAIDEAAGRMHMPNSIHGSFQGTAKVFQDSLATEPLLILAALLAVYIILGILYESLIHPLTIISTLPSAGVGALLALLLTGHDLDVVGIIGIILLMGIVKKNAIMMIDFALEIERSEGLTPEESIYRACIVRFRPITMTTMAALFGALPLALEGGVGAELHKPLGISIVGGLIVSQMLTLFTTPVVYVALDKLQHRLRRKKRRAAAPAIIGAPAVR